MNIGAFVRFPRMVTLNSVDAGIELARKYGVHPREVMTVFHVRQDYEAIGYHIAAVGSSSRLVYEPRDVYRPLIVESDSGMLLLAHNHPWEKDGRPSPADYETTRKFIQASRYLGIFLLDHIVVGEKYCFSFRSMGAVFPKSDYYSINDEYRKFMKETVVDCRQHIAQSNVLDGRHTRARTRRRKK